MSLLQHPFSRFIFALSIPNWLLAAAMLFAATVLTLDWCLTPPPLALVTQVCNMPPVETLTAPRPSTRFRPISTHDLGQPLRLFGGVANTVPCRSSGLEHPGAMRRRPNPSPPPAKRKKAKSVVFAEDRNEVRLVENWIVTGLHIHSMPNGHVRWDSYDEIWPVDRWIVPHGRDQLHFPRTKWIRHGPDPALEDQDGDVEMRDLVGVGEQLSAVTMDVLVEGLARLSVG